MGLLEKARSAVPNKPAKWVKYKPVWEELKRNGYQPTEAARWIGEEEHLSESDVTKLTNQIKAWKFKSK